MERKTTCSRFVKKLEKFKQKLWVFFVLIKVLVFLVDLVLDTMKRT